MKIKKIIARLERTLVRVALNPKYRPLEHRAAVRLARSVALRWGVSSAVLSGVLEVIDRVLS